MTKVNEEILGCVFHDVKKEIQRQRKLQAKGKFRYTCDDLEMSDYQKLAVLVEEIGEVSRVMMNMDKIANDFFAVRFAKEDEHLQKEIIQVAAVACAWLMGFRKERG